MPFAIALMATLAAIGFALGKGETESASSSGPAEGAVSDSFTYNCRQTPRGKVGLSRT